jgi:predicted O-linked N-acetylglucosamine transferase (SPINDLY family)
MLEAEERALGETPLVIDRLYWIAPYRYTSQSSLVDLCRRLQRFADSAVQPVKTRLRTAEPTRLRIGYLSADFREHSVACFIEPLLACHDRTRFTVVCYCLNEKHDATTARLRTYADEWLEARTLGLRELAERIAADEIDILIDLSGRTLGSKAAAAAFRPATLQLTYLGFPTYTGIEQIDFRVTDSVIDPESDHHELEGERPLRLPGSMFCYRPPAAAPEPTAATPPARGLRFGSFNQLPKLSPLTLRLWAAILARVPGAVLVLKAFAFDEQSARERVVNAFEALGIDAGRLEIRPADGAKQDHFAAYRDIDVALDAAPYNGATTTCEALWMGVPVITLAGETHAQRMGASLLRAIGLDDLVAHNEKDYVQAAIDLATDPVRRGELRTTLRQRFERSSLRDERGFALGFETSIRQAWRERWLTFQ